MSAFMALPAFADNADLFDAIIKENEVKLANELQYNYIVDRSAMVDGKTALMLAVKQEWRRGVEMLLNKRVDPNRKGNGGETALMIGAGSNSDVEIVKLLLNNNANVNARNDMGKTALMYAAENKIPVVLNYLLSQPAISLDQVNNDGEDALIIAAKENNEPAVTALLKKSIRNLSRVSTSDRRSAFMWACYNNNVDMVRIFLESGKVDMYQTIPGQGSNQALPVLLWAINANISVSIISELVDYYTDSLDDIVDRQGRNAWYYATLRKMPTVQRMLREKGITVNNAANTQG